MHSLTMQVDGMSCGYGVASVNRALTTLEGVHIRAVRLGSAEVVFDPGVTTPDEISHALGRAGYAVRSMAQSGDM